MISEYQVYLARYYQADAILLMLSVVNDETYRVLADLAHSLGMGAVSYTHLAYRSFDDVIIGFRQFKHTFFDSINVFLR